MDPMLKQFFSPGKTVSNIVMGGTSALGFMILVHF